MSRKVMVAHRPDSHGEDALALARVLAEARLVTEILVVEVVDDDKHKAAAERRLLPFTEGWPQDTHVSARAVAGDSVPETLRSLADEERVDALVLGSTHRGVAGRVLLGTTAGHVFPEASWPVLVAPKGYRETAGRLRRIGVAFDGSIEAGVALDWAVTLASKTNAGLRLIAVAEPPPPPAETWAGTVPADAWAEGLTLGQSMDMLDVARERREHELEAARASIGLATEVETTTIVGDPVEELRATAADLDFVVVGSHGRGRLDSAVMGSVSRSLANSCPAPLAVVPAPAAAPSGASSATSSA